MAYIHSNPNQTYLIPPKITDLFSKDHVCYLIEQIANEMDYSEFDEKYAGAGAPAYHPRVNLKLLTLAYIDGIRSSRRISKNSQENVVYIYLAEKMQPDFRTISDFRKDNRKLVKNTFKQIIQFAHKQGLIDLSHLMIDGTIIKANAQDDRKLDKKTIEKLERYIDREIQKGIEVDEKEDELYGDRSFHRLPDDLDTKEKRQKIVREIVDEINKSMKKGDKENVKQIKSALLDLKQDMKKQGLKRLSITDPDCRFMMNKKGKIELSYNAQLVTDKNGLIISNDVINKCNDRNQLLPNIRRVEEDFGKLPKGTILSADQHYTTGNDVVILDQEGFDIYSSIYGMNKDVKNKFDKINFTYDEENDRYICPEGKSLRKAGTAFRTHLNAYATDYRASRRDCRPCQYRKECCKSMLNKQITALSNDKVLNRIKDKMQTEEGKALYNLRKQTVETGFGDIKHNKKFREFLLRGVKKVKTEWDLVCMASNLVKINNLMKKRSLAGC